MDELPFRKVTRLGASEYLGPIQCFVTICCYQRRAVFADAERYQWVVEALRSESAGRDFSVLAYCVMPDHLHFLAEGMRESSDLLSFVRSFKLKTSREFARQGQGMLWQRGFYDHVLRKGEAAEDVCWYIWLNPVRKGMVAKAQEHRFSGSFAGLEMPKSWAMKDWRPPWK